MLHALSALFASSTPLHNIEISKSMAALRVFLHQDSIACETCISVNVMNYWRIDTHKKA